MSQQISDDGPLNPTTEQIEKVKTAVEGLRQSSFYSDNDQITSILNSSSLLATICFEFENESDRQNPSQLRRLAILSDSLTQITQLMKGEDLAPQASQEG